LKTAEGNRTLGAIDKDTKHESCSTNKCTILLLKLHK